MKAIITDIHGNFEALSAVFHDIEEQGIKEVVCLGDIVGYGAEPEACTDMIMQKCAFSLMGNHDFALIYGPIGFNPVAAEIIRITHDRMEPHVAHKAGIDNVIDEKKYPCTCEDGESHCTIKRRSTHERWKYIEKLPHEKHEKNVVYVHGSVIDPVYEYVFPDTIASLWNPLHLAELFEKIPWLCFCGHTHHPCAITDQSTCLYPNLVNNELLFDKERKYIVNGGSVGQPRDGDPRASYLVFDEKENRIFWRRVAYDIDAAAAKIEAMCGKGNWCAERIKLGK